MIEFLDGVLAGLRAVFDLHTLGESVANFLARLVAGALTFTAFYLLWRLIGRGLDAGLRRSRVDATTASFVTTVAKFAVLTLGAVQGLSAAGVDTAAVIASLGIAGLTLGFAARDALSNLISGVLIFWDRPFVIGDLVEVGGEYGRVDRITLRSTRVVTPDGRMLAVPNATIINQTVASYTNVPHLRVAVDVDIGPQVPFEQVRKLLLEMVARDPDFMQEPAPQVVVTQLGTFNNTMQLQAWVFDERRHGEKRVQLRENVYRTLLAAGVDMPVETLNLLPLDVRSATPAAQGRG